MHKLETIRSGKVNETRTATEEKHTLSRDDKARESEQNKDGQQRKITHELETRM
jgi:hypothetical protein